MSLITRMSDCHPDRKHFSKGKCKQCYNREYRITHPQPLERRRQWDLASYSRNPIRKRINNLWSQFRLRPDDYEAILRRQDYHCMFCNATTSVNRKSKTGPLLVDHNHVTGVVRGLLCTRHNNAVGHIEKNRNILSQILEYLDTSG